MSVAMKSIKVVRVPVEVNEFYLPVPVDPLSLSAYPSVAHGQQHEHREILVKRRDSGVFPDVVIGNTLYIIE
jgi:hypothetical protein